MLNKFFLCATLLLLCLGAKAQSAKKIKYGYVNPANEWVIPAGYDYVQPFSEGLAVVTLKKGQGYIDKQGNKITKIEYAQAEQFSEGLGVVLDAATEKWGAVDKTGKVVLGFEFFALQSFSNGLARAAKEEAETTLFGFVDKTGNWRIPAAYEEAEAFVGGVAQVQKKGLWGLIDTTGKIILPCKYERLRYYHKEKLVIANEPRKKTSVFALAKPTQPIILPAACTPLHLSDGLLMLQKNNLYGYADLNGKLVIPCQYDAAMNFSEGIAAVKQKKNWSIINKKGVAVINLKESSFGVLDFENGVAKIMDDNGKYGLIAANGTVLLAPRFEFMGNFCQGFARVEENENFGFINLKGELVIPLLYKESRLDHSEGLFPVGILK